MRALSAGYALCALAVIFFFYKTDHAGCSVSEVSLAKYDCVEVFFATPRALGALKPKSRLNSDRMIALPRAEELNGKERFVKSFGDHPLILGRAIVHLPRLNAKDEERLSRTSNQSQEAERRRDLDAKLRSEFKMNKVDIFHLAVSSDGLLDIDRTPYRVLNGAVEAGKQIAPNGKRTALLFVHGFNTTFDDSVKQTARLAADLNFDQRVQLGSKTAYGLGQPLLFTWPALTPDLKAIAFEAALGALPIPADSIIGPVSQIIDEFGVNENGSPKCLDEGSILAVLAEGGGSILAEKLNNLRGAVLGAATGATLEAWDQFIDKYLVSACRAQREAVVGLEQYLSELISATDVETLNIIAYSMGSEVAARAIPSALERERQLLAGRAFSINLVHYGADVSVDDYDALIAKIDAALDYAPPERVRATLYSNQHDLALQASAVITGKHRAGRHGAQGDPPVYRANLQAAPTDLNGDPSHSTVDISLLSGKLFSRGFNHALFQETPEMLGDIACFMRGSRIDDRGLERRDPSDGRGEYFILAAGKKSAICGGPAWEIGELDCDSWFEMAAERSARSGAETGRSA